MELWNKSEIMALSVPERIRLVGDIWDSIAESPQAVPLTKGQRVLLDERLRAYRDNPSEGSSWQDVKARIKSLR